MKKAKHWPLNIKMELNRFLNSSIALPPSVVAHDVLNGFALRKKTRSDVPNYITVIKKDEPLETLMNAVFT
ncbi:hypothetical protein KF728_24600 [Candidatus Obscuribacterales bacterium]|nr:hypothetical protein [Candidatus Obscuribacterales bacterium]